MPQHLEALTWNQLVEELRALAEHRPASDGPPDDPKVALHNLLVHQVELEMQNRELRDAQQRLEASRARYADLYDFAPVGCLTVDDDERIVEINLTGAALLGRDRAEIIGKPFLGVVPLREKAMIFHEHIRLVMEKRCRNDTELEFLPRGRAPIWLHMTSSPMLDANGNATACRIALLDVTDRRRAEHAEADARMKEEFLGTVSHELRTPLAAIKGWADLLRAQELGGGELDRALLRRGLDVIARNAGAQGRLIEDILDVSRILAGKLRVDMRPTDLEPLVRAAVEGLGPAAATKGISLSVSVAPDSVVLADGDRITQVLTNLLNNSLKFTPAGGTIGITVTGESHLVTIAVRDTGRGMQATELPRVFERFQQMDSSTTRAAGGLGLGLAIVDHIVRGHGGSVVALSPGLGLGATFVVRLRKAHGPPRSEAAPLPPAGEASLEGRRILCVDDDVDTLEVLALVLREYGALVTTAQSAAEALEAIAASTPDVVVSDIGLPEEDGYELIHRIRALPGDAARVPAVAVTAYASAASARRATEAGFQHFLSKPIVVEELVRVVAGLPER